MSESGDGAAPLERIKAIVEAWNRGERTLAASWFADLPIIIDNTPPYLFHGADAIEAWEKSYVNSLTTKQKEASHKLILGSENTIEVEKDRAYVAISAKWVETEGVTDTVASGTLTITLKRDSEDWRVAAWVWAARL